MSQDSKCTSMNPPPLLPSSRIHLILCPFQIRQILPQIKQPTMLGPPLAQELHTALSMANRVQAHMCSPRYQLLPHGPAAYTHTHTLSHSLTHSLFAPLSLTHSILVVFKHPHLALAKYAILDFPPALCLLACPPPQDCTVMTSPCMFPALRNGNLTPLHIYHHAWPRQRRATVPIPPLPSIFYAILSFCSTAKQ